MFSVSLPQALSPLKLAGIGMGLLLLAGCNGANQDAEPTEGNSPVAISTDGPQDTGAALLCAQYENAQKVAELAEDGEVEAIKDETLVLSQNLRAISENAGYASPEAVFTALRGEGPTREEVIEAVEARCSVDAENAAFDRLITEALGQ